MLPRDDEMLAQHAFVEAQRIGLGHQAANVIASERILPRLDHSRHFHALRHTDVKLHRPALPQGFVEVIMS
jgi:hypothetical protein